MAADFFDLWDQASRAPERPAPAPLAIAPSGDLTGYIGKVCDGVATAANGTRNAKLNEASYTLGRLIDAHRLDENEITSYLREAARQAGLDEHEIDPTITSGLTAGKKEPRALEARETIAPPPVTVLPEQAELDAFWDSRPALQRIRQYAQARMCSPWAVLGCALVRVIVATPPYLALPPIVGSYASLNLYVALVGPSGTGKGAADAAAGDALHVGHLDHAHVGSGEGISHLFAKREKGELVRTREAVLFTIPEVDNMVALGARQGATLMPQLRMAWSGESLGFAYVDPTKNLRVERHTYRLGLLLGVQPGRATPLLDDADGGTPQRFLWMPTTDPDAPDNPPAEPEPLEWALPTEPRLANVHGLTVIDVPEHVRATVVANRQAKLRGEGDALDGHAMLARLKAAAAFALLEQRTRIDDQDWDLSGTLMAVSDACRAGVQAHLSQTRKASNVARGEAEAERVLLVSERVEEAAIKRVAQGIRRHLTKAGGDMARSDLRRKISSPDRPHFEDAVTRLIDVGQLLEQDTDHGVRIVLKEEK